MKHPPSNCPVCGESTRTGFGWIVDTFDSNGDPDGTEASGRTWCSSCSWAIGYNTRNVEIETVGYDMKNATIEGDAWEIDNPDRLEEEVLK